MKEYKEEEPEMKNEWRLLVDILIPKPELQEHTQIDQMTQIARSLSLAEGVYDTVVSMIKGVSERLEEEKGEGNFQLKNIKLWVQSGKKQSMDLSDHLPRPLGYFSVLKSLHEGGGSNEPLNYVLEIFIYFE